MARIETVELKALVDAEVAALFFFAFGKDEWKADELALALRTRTRIVLTVVQAVTLCDALVEKGIFAPPAPAATPTARRYRLAGRLPFATLQQLAKRATTAGWWGQGWREGQLVLRALFTGGREMNKAMHDLFDEAGVWKEIGVFADFTRGEKVFPVKGFPAGTHDLAYVVLGSIFFAEGRDFTVLLADWRANRKKWKFDSAVGVMEYVAWCVWAGKGEWLDVVDADAAFDSSVGEFLAGCKALVKGDLAEAYRLTASYTSFCSGRGYEELVEQFGLLASSALALMISLFHKPTKTRTARLAARVCPYYGSAAGGLPAEMNAEGTKRCRLLHSFRGVDPKLAYEIEPEFAAIDRGLPAAELGRAAVSLAVGLDRDVVVADRRHFLAAVDGALAMGCPTLAGMLLSTFGWAFSEETERICAEDAARRVTEMHGLWLRSFEVTAGASPWRTIIAEFDKRLPEAKKQPGAGGISKRGRVAWLLRFAVRTGDFVLCRGLTPCYRGPRGADDGADDRPLTMKAFESGKYDECFAPGDRDVAAAIRRVDYNFKHAGPVPSDVLAALCGLDNVCEDVAGTGTRQSIRIARRDVVLTAVSTEEGGLKLAVPGWSVGVETDCVLRREESDVFGFTPFSRGLKDVLDVFREYGEDGVLVVPKDAMDEMRALMGRMGALFPIQGDLQSIGEGASFERVAGDPTPLVRLDFGEDGLGLRLRARPLDTQPDVLFEPGVGQPERVVNVRGGTAVVVRDVEQERKNAAVVQEALADFEAWRDGNTKWRIEDLEDALAALAALKDLGQQVRLEWKKGKLKVSNPTSSKAQWAVTESSDRWFSVTGAFTLDDGRVLSVVELISHLQERVGRFVPFGDGEYVKLTAALVKRLETLAAASRIGKNTLDLPPSAIPGLVRTFGADADALPEKFRDCAAEYERAFTEKVEPPARLKAQLRPYQEEGYAWLVRLASCGFGACLADDMGLGKTVQTIALLLARSAQGPSLVVAPASVCGNWRREIAKFAPTLSIVTGGEFTEGGKVAPHVIVVCSYGLLVSREQDFSAVEWNGVVLDEAQAIKNEDAKRAKAAKSLKAKFRVVATGTPVENRLSELWSLFDFLNPGLLGPSSSFYTRMTEDGRPKTALKRLVSPFILRRLKRDVLEDLPPKTEITLPVDLGEAERLAYEGCRKHALDALAGEGKDNRISILAELTRLRRFCCHPSLVIPGFKESAKMEALEELLADLKANGHRALVFSQFTDYLGMVRDRIRTRGWGFRYLDGATAVAERERQVAEFQQGEGDFFLISLKAGGMGLNLTSANYVILLDPWWNPAVEDQAADRVHRIGQKEPVTVYRLVAADTVEERVLDLHGEKRALADDVLGDAAHKSLTPAELMKLFG